MSTAARIANHSHLDRPGPQAENRIAATALAQLARAKAGRRPEPLSPAEAERIVATFRQYPEAFARAILNLVAEDIGAIASAVIDSRAKPAYRRDARAS